MPRDFVCPECHSLTTIDEGWVEHTGCCRHCGARVTVSPRNSKPALSPQRLQFRVVFVAVVYIMALLTAFAAVVFGQRFF